DRCQPKFNERLTLAGDQLKARAVGFIACGARFYRVRSRIELQRPACAAQGFSAVDDYPSSPDGLSRRIHHSYGDRRDLGLEFGAPGRAALADDFVTGFGDAHFREGTSA